MKNNKLFQSKIVKNTQGSSRIKYNRAYLMSSKVAQEFNTYNYLGIFASYNDVYEKDIDPQTYKEKPKAVGIPSVRSLFNRSAAVLIGGTQSDSAKYAQDDGIRTVRTKASELRVYNNAPLMDSPQTRAAIRKHSGCSVKELVQQSQNGLLGQEIYSYADFMYCKHLGKVPNNYLITLRRFAAPPGDCITNIGVGKTKKGVGKNLTPAQVGCLVTWLGTPGNEMENILKYSVTMPFEEKTAKWETVQGGDADSGGGILNGIAAVFDSGYRKQYTSGQGGTVFNNLVKQIYGPLGDSLGQGPYPTTPFIDANKVYGPIDQVKKTYMRSEEGLDFKQNITITFDYELRSYNGVNARQAFLDLLATILVVTYSTGGFWGGGYRGGGMHQNSIFSNLNIFKAKGGFTNFVSAFSKDVDNLKQKAKSTIAAHGGIWETIKSLLNDIGGMLVGGMLNQMGRPVQAYANSLLSERPVGFWHLTIGNPNHPIMTMGNMILKNTTITHYGPLGLDDFPTGIKVVCELDRGKGRDSRNIEAIYMSGNDRIYSSMNEKVLDIYNNAKSYGKWFKNKDKKPFAAASNKEMEDMVSSNNAVAGLKDNTLNSLTISPQEINLSAAIPKGVLSARGASATGNILTANLKSKAATPNQTQTATKSDVSSEKQEAVTEQATSDASADPGIDFNALGIEDPNATLTGDALKAHQATLMKYFGETDTYSIVFQSMEQEYGSALPKGKNQDNQSGSKDTGTKSKGDTNQGDSKESKSTTGK